MPWRVVESQFVNSTRKLVDSAEEQRLLEELIDGAKPPNPSDVVERSLHYLLATPFRHPPLRHGSRWGQRTERGIFYAAKEVETSLAELAYYRLVFFDGSPALQAHEVELSSFQAHVSTQLGVDVTVPPFSRFEAQLASPTDYSATQAMGRDMREDGVEVIVYRSARSVQPGFGVAVLSPAAFARKEPSAMHQWVMFAERDRIEIREKNLMSFHVFSFERTLFEVEGRLPSPSV